MVRPVAYCILVFAFCFSDRFAMSQESGKAAPPPSNSKRLEGKVGASPEWGSGWIDLAAPMDFSKGDRLRIKIGGTASRILVRLLPRGTSAGSSAGIVGDAMDVPKSRIVEVVLDADRKGIIQISVHGGPNPWGMYPLGEGNGPATLEYVDLIKASGSSGSGGADAAPSNSKRLEGRVGASQEWRCGWIDLAAPTDFVKGDRLRIKIGGTANKILVRLLPRGTSAESSEGIIGDAVDVPKSRIVEVVLDTDRNGIIQISVHGGPSPWGTYPLGEGNGPATLEYVELIRP